MAAGGTLVELRVHGVSGTPPEALLSCPTEFLEEVAGDKSAGFYRRQPWLEDATSGPPGAWRKVLEAYSWGGLTSGPASRAAGRKVGDAGCRARPPPSSSSITAS